MTGAGKTKYGGVSDNVVSAQFLNTVPTVVRQCEGYDTPSARKHKQLVSVVK